MQGSYNYKNQQILKKVAILFEVLTSGILFQMKRLLILLSSKYSLCKQQFIEVKKQHFIVPFGCKSNPKPEGCILASDHSDFSRGNALQRVLSEVGSFLF